MAQATLYRPFNADEFLNLGLENRCKTDAWKRRNHESRNREFVVDFGIHPRALEVVWLNLQQTPFVNFRIDASVKPLHLLVVYRWFKGYEPASSLRRSFGICENIIRDICKDLPYKIAAIRKLKVSGNILWFIN